MGNLDGIDTIVIAMMENRSFDHLLGFLSHESFPDRRADVNGLHQHGDHFSWDNPDDAGNLYFEDPTTDLLMAGAARRVIATAEVRVKELPRVTIPSFQVERVAEVPGGAWPTG